MFIVSKFVNVVGTPLILDTNCVPFSTMIYDGLKPVVLKVNLTIASEAVTDFGIYPMLFA